MERNKKIIAGIFFLLIAAVFAYNIVKNGAQSYLVTGLVMFLFIGFGFLRSSRK